MQAITRRAVLAGASALAARSQSNPPPAPPPPRKQPLLCLFSKYLQKLEYVDLGPIIHQLGFEGCDLTVRPGGHVEPDKVQVDLMRALESLRHDGVEVGMITTDITSPAPFASRAILAIAGHSGVGCFQPGAWSYGPGDDIERRLADVRQQAAAVSMLGRAYGIAAGFRNETGDHVGGAVWDTWVILQGLDPRWAGFYFDPCYATAEGGVAGWDVALRLAMPRLKMLAVQDFYWEKTAGKWRMRMCPLGQGMVDWPQVCSRLAAAKFTGPISLYCEYQPDDLLGAIAKDLAYLRKHLDAAYGTAK